MLAMAVTRPTTKRRIPKTFIACLLGGWCKTYSLGGALRPFDGVYEISDPLQFLQYSTAHRYDWRAVSDSMTERSRGSTVAQRLIRCDTVNQALPFTTLRCPV